MNTHLIFHTSQPVDLAIHITVTKRLPFAITDLSWQLSTESKPTKITDHPAIQWLSAYFKHQFQPIDFPIQPEGTPFQKRVWQALMDIPSGTTQTYGTVAKALNTAPRAIGHAVGANPIPLIIPCHRVVSAQGIGGYSATGGVEIKKQLLDWETYSHLDPKFDNESQPEWKPW
ncbi:MAG: methylated-DNA--[protein]-cysteine S-methyltransferase [Magnetococcales bacterium]|nr:methylated-DNA--[protein]-cysteine S-methyltransferase [Magnetococcales bacterium]